MLADVPAIVSKSSEVGFPLLTVLIFVPYVGAVIALCTPNRRTEIARSVGYVTSTAVLGMALFLLTQFDTGATKGGYQLYETHSWLRVVGMRWTLGVDGISLFMVALTALLIPIGLLASARIEKAKAFTVWMLLLEGAVIGLFLSADALLFFVFFEFSLVPMYFLIAQWGHGRRRYAATKFFLFTMAGSAFLFVAILTVAFLNQHDTGTLTFDIRTLTNYAASNISGTPAKALFLAMAIGFAVKVPLFPFHTWLPDAHTDAPTAGSVVLAGVMLKMGTYGFLRLAIPFFPQAAVTLAPVLLIVGVIGITYGAIVAAMQPNLKRIIAYSSIAHLGFVVVGIFALTKQGLSGGLFTMLSHGLTTGALFLLVGMLYERRHTYELSDYRGLWKAVPVFGGIFVATTFASIGLPGFSGFIGEFLSLLGAFLTSRWYVVVATTGVILAAVYLLWAVQRAFTGEPDEENLETPDIGIRELVTVVPLLGLSLFLGFYPQPVLDRLEPSVDALVAHVQQHSDLEIPPVSNTGPLATLASTDICTPDANGKLTVHITAKDKVVKGSKVYGKCEGGAP
jgi:NADH-quinone oxidoreductase subunit M